MTWFATKAVTGRFQLYVYWCAVASTIATFHGTSPSFSAKSIPNSAPFRKKQSAPRSRKWRKQTAPDTKRSWRTYPGNRTTFEKSWIPCRNSFHDPRSKKYNACFQATFWLTSIRPRVRTRIYSLHLPWESRNLVLSNLGRTPRLEQGCRSSGVQACAHRISWDLI